MSPYAAATEVMGELEGFSAKDILLQLFRRLGKYDTEIQISSIADAKNQVQQLLQQMEQECGKKSKAYEVLCVCAGLAVVILLV